MRCIDVKSKQGMTLVEVMVTITIFSILGAAIAGTIFMQGRSYRYNYISNANVSGASLALNRIVYGDSGRWGLRVASRSGVTITPTGVVGPNGAQGWRAVCRHNIDTTSPDLPALLQTPTLTIVYDPIAQTLRANDDLVGSRVADAYFTIQGGTVSLGVQVESENGGLEAMVETRVRLRNS